MALTTPILFSTGALDGTKENVFEFNVLGGDLVNGSVLTITEQGSSTPTVENVISNSYDFYNTLPANSISNNKTYTAYLRTKHDSTLSSPSNIIYFYTYATPSFAFTVPSPHAITTSNETFYVNYARQGGDLVSQLSQYVFNLYDQNHNLISTSGSMYNTALGDTSVEYTFSGFQNGGTYYVKCEGITKEGMKIETSELQITVSSQTTPFDYFTVTNNCDNGYIDVVSRVTDITGETNAVLPSPYTEVDLTDDGLYLKWDKDFTLPTNFSLQVWGKSFNDGTIVTQFSTVYGDKIEIYYYENGTDCSFVLYVIPILYADNSTMRYVIESNDIEDFGDYSELTFRATYENGLYKLEAGGIS